MTQQGTFYDPSDVSLDMGSGDMGQPPQQSQSFTGSSFPGGKLGSDLSGQLAGHMLEMGTKQAKEAFSLYGRIDILRPYFDVEPAQVRKRLLTALVPERLTGTPPLVVSELYGPLMVVLTLIAVLLAGMKATGHTMQEGTLMGTAMGTCFGYWLGASAFFFALAYFCDTELSPIEVLSLCGYGLFGTLVCMGLSTLLIATASNLFFYATWGVFGVSSALRMAYIFLSRTAVRKQGITISTIVAVVHLLFILYLKFVYHKTYEAASKIIPV